MHKYSLNLDTLYHVKLTQFKAHPRNSHFVLIVVVTAACVDTSIVYCLVRAFVLKESERNHLQNTILVINTKHLNYQEKKKSPASNCTEQKKNSRSVMPVNNKLSLLVSVL